MTEFSIPPEALEAAAKVAWEAQLYTPWENCSEPLRAAWKGNTEKSIQAFLTAMGATVERTHVYTFDPSPPMGQSIIGGDPENAQRQRLVFPWLPVNQEQPQ